MPQTIIGPEAPKNCELCPRLVRFRNETAEHEPGWYNGAVPSFGDPKAELLIVGLAPGLRGANRTGRPLTGDASGEMLFEMLSRHGFTAGTFGNHVDDGLTLKGAMITNAVRCVPPQNRPTGMEVNACRPFLAAQIIALPRLTLVVTLGKIAHDSTIRALGLRLRDYPFGHNRLYGFKANNRSLSLLSSYHCSRYNLNTRRLTEEMFCGVFQRARRLLDNKG